MKENQQQRAVHIAEGEGKMLWVANELMTFKVSSEDTGGMYALTDSVVLPQGEAPLHIHHREDEAFWVLEGELEILVGEDTFRASAGSFVAPTQRRRARLQERRHGTSKVSYPDSAGRLGEVFRSSRQTRHRPVFPTTL